MSTHEDIGPTSATLAKSSTSWSTSTAMPAFACQTREVLETHVNQSCLFTNEFVCSTSSCTVVVFEASYSRAPLRDLLDAPTALAACSGFDLCYKYILYLYLYLYLFVWYHCTRPALPWDYDTILYQYKGGLLQRALARLCASHCGRSL